MNKYLHDNERIRDRREEKYSRRGFSEKLSALSEEVGRPGVFNITEERIERIEKKESAELSLREAIALAKALELKVGELIAEEYHGLLKDTEIGTYAELRHFANDEELYSYLCEVEAEGRIGIFHDFPSDAYYIAEFDGLCPKAIERADNIISKRVPNNSEFYTIKSLLLFAFCEVRKHADEHKRMIIEKIIKAFKDDYQKRLCFFDSTGSKIGESFPDMEIIVPKSLLLVEMPIPSYSILEIKNKQIVKIIDNFFRDEKSFRHSIDGRDAIHLLEILNECISEL